MHKFWLTEKEVGEVLGKAWWGAQRFRQGQTRGPSFLSEGFGGRGEWEEGEVSR